MAETLAVSPVWYEDEALMSQPILLYEPTVVEEKEQPSYTGCVQYIREKFKIPVRGDALFIRPNLVFSETRPGDIVVFLYGMGWQKSHVALIRKITNQGIYVSEWTEQSGERERWVSLNDKHIIGFYRP